MNTKYAIAMLNLKYIIYLYILSSHALKFQLLVFNIYDMI